VKKTIRLTAFAVGLGLVSTLAGMGTAQADPGTPQPPYRALQGEGSDTSEAVMNALSEVVKDQVGTPLIASYNAVGTSGFQTRVSASCVYQGNPNPSSSYVEGFRANGSGNGRKALTDAFTAGKTTSGCLDFARSSSVGAAQASLPLSYVPFALDSLAFAVTNTSNFPRQLTFQDLKDIYHCTYPGTTGASPSLHALIPQAGSGTRSSWLALVGLTESDLTTASAFACVSDQKTRTGRGGSQPIEEHFGNVLDNNSIVGISVAQYIAQSEGAMADVRGRAVLGAVSDGAVTPTLSYPMSMNSSYGTVSGNASLNVPATRQIYNVVPNKVLNNADPAFNQTAVNVFVDTDGSAGVNTSLLCAQSSVIAKFGFGILANCGQVAVTQ
jgi:ABC-type phosphate transport system substrate-binding protein